MKHIVNWTPKKKRIVLAWLTLYLSDHPSGEHICQSDSAHIDGIELLCDIADLVEPEYIEED